MSADKSSPIEQAYRKEFVAALNLLAQACEVMIKRPGVDFKPVLVGGAAAELMSGGMFTSGDFDFVTPWQEAFEEALIGLGFVRPILPGHISRGLLHPPTQTSVEVVGSRLMDGAADGRRTFEVRIGEGAVRVIAVEDLIADRMAQYGESRRQRVELLQQAKVIFQLDGLAGQVDEEYLDRRIRHETANEFGLEDLKRALDD